MPISTTESQTGQCARCAQTRPLWRYVLQRPELHDPAGEGFSCLGMHAYFCPRCSRKEQPLLCAPCWSTEADGELALAFGEEELP